jgi:hypothetical protein
MWLSAQTSGHATYKLSNLLVSSFVNTLQVAICAAACMLLATTLIFLVYLRVQLSGSTALLYMNKGSALKLTLCEVTKNFENLLLKVVSCKRTPLKSS